MKTRKGFVSNSSSSSFILGVPKNKKASDIMIKVSIEDCVDYKLSTVQEIEDYFLGEYGDDQTFKELVDEEGEWIQKSYDLMVQELEKGNIIIVGTASNEGGDSPAEYAIYLGALDDLADPDVTVIQGAEC